MQVAGGGARICGLFCHTSVLFLLSLYMNVSEWEEAGKGIQQGIRSGKWLRWLPSELVSISMSRPAFTAQYRNTTAFLSAMGLTSLFNLFCIGMGLVLNVGPSEPKLLEGEKAYETSVHQAHDRKKTLMQNFMYRIPVHSVKAWRLYATGTTGG